MERKGNLETDPKRAGQNDKMVTPTGWIVKPPTDLVSHAHDSRDCFAERCQKILSAWAHAHAELSRWLRAEPVALGTKSPSHDERSAPSHDEWKSLSQDEWKSPSHDQWKSLSHDQWKSLSHDKGKSLSQDEWKSPSHDEWKSVSHDEWKIERVKKERTREELFCQFSALAADAVMSPRPVFESFQILDSFLGSRWPVRILAVPLDQLPHTPGNPRATACWPPAVLHRMSTSTMLPTSGSSAPLRCSPPLCRFAASFIIASSPGRLDEVFQAELLRLGYGPDLLQARTHNLHNLDITGVARAPTVPHALHFPRDLASHRDPSLAFRL